MDYLVNDKRIDLNAFVIVSNHIHLIWPALVGFNPSKSLGIFYEIYGSTDKALTHQK